MMFMRCFALTVVLSFSATAQAIPIGVVGSVDNFAGSTTLPNSGQATEENWCGPCTMTFRDNNGANGWQAVDGLTNTYAHALVTSPEAFLIKLGVGNSGAHTHYGFINLGSLDWAVIDFTVMLANQPAGFNFNLGRISHISEFNGRRVTVPEPATWALFGLGLVSIGLGRRRRNR